MNIEAKKLVTEDLKDYNTGEDYNIGLSGIDRKNAVPQTHLNYESHDKEQDTNATFSNVVVTENGTKVDFDARGINTDITKAQIVTKDEVVDPIDTDLHTDLLNPEKRKELANETNLLLDNVKVIGTSIAIKLENNKTGDTDAEMGFKEKQTLANITKVTEEVVKNRDNLVLSETDRESKEKLQDAVKEKYGKYGIIDVKIIEDGEKLQGTDGKMHEVNGAFSLDGVVYITESTANGSLKELNRVVGEEVGEIYAHNNGLEKNGNAEQLGRIFAEKISNGVGDTNAKNPLIADNVDLSKVVINGADLWLVYHPKGLIINHIAIWDDETDKLYSYGQPVGKNFAVNNNVLIVSNKEDYIDTALNKDKSPVMLIKLNLTDEEESKAEKNLINSTNGLKIYYPSDEKKAQDGTYYNAPIYLFIGRNCGQYVYNSLDIPMYDFGGGAIVPWDIVDWSLNKKGGGSNLDIVTHSTEIRYYDVNGKVHYNNVLNKSKDEVQKWIDNIKKGK